MFSRILQFPKNHHFFLFGARNTGKSTLLESRFLEENSVLFDLLDQDLEVKLRRKPNAFFDMVQALPADKTHVIIDEVQKVPELLNVVHRLMKDKNRTFIMTGSSARKLKHAGVNLLAGRAFVYHLYPLSFVELGKDFDLDSALQWGTLPEVFIHSSEELKREFLMAYAHTYLKEEIALEQLVRDLDPFRRFLEVAAQCNGKVINYSNVARDVGVDDKTVKNYFSILEDTLVGFLLEPYNGSFRKRIKQSPKFYFFDNGVARALAKHLSIPLLPSTHAYGDAFENFIINEIISLTSYYRKDFSFSYLRTDDNYEIDLVVERPGQKLLLLEFKSTDDVEDRMLQRFGKISAEYKDAEAICLSRDPYAKKISTKSGIDVLVLPWREGLKKIFEF